MAKPKPNPKKAKKNDRKRKVSKNDSPSSSSDKAPTSSSPSTSPPKKSRKSDEPKKPTPSPCSRVTERINPIKSLTDPNDYRIIRLSNGLIAAMISRRDPLPFNTNGNPSSFGGSGFGVGFQNLLNQKWQRKGIRRRTQFSNSDRSPFQSAFTKHGTSSSKKGGISFKLKACREDTDVPPDPEFSSIYVVVSVGGLSDPISYQGLSHFLEHSLYLGSKNFPSADAFELELSNFIEFNATTVPETTSFYNDRVPNILLKDTMESFSDMLANPLLREESLRRELSSIDSEYYRKLHRWNSFDVHPPFLLKDPKHPFGRFLCGNKDHLKISENSRGKLRNAMQAHHKNYYVATGMCVCINSTKSLDELEELILSHFSHIPAGSRQLLHSLVEGEPPKVKGTNCGEKGQLYTYIEGKFHWGELHLLWIISDRNSELKGRLVSKVSNDVLHCLLSDNSAGSLKASLYRQGFIFEMLVSVDHYKSYRAIQNSIIIYLTKAGMSQTEKILSEVNSFLKNLKNSQENDMNRYFGEIRKHFLRTFHYGRQEASLDFTQNCGMSLQNTANLKTLLSVESWSDAQLDFKAIINLLTQMLDWNNLVIIEILPKQVKLDDICKKEEIPQETAFQTNPLTKTKYLTITKKIELTNSSQRYDFPLENILLKTIPMGNAWGCVQIPSPPPNFGNIPTHQRTFKSKMDPEGGGRYLPKISGVHWGHDEVGDTRYYAEINLTFLSFFLRSKTPRTIGLGYIWSRVIYNKLRPKRDQMLMLGYSYEITPFMEVYIQGFPEHIYTIVDDILTAIFNPIITQLEFDLARDYVTQQLEETTSEPEYIIDAIIYSLTDPLAAISQDSFDIIGQFEDLTLVDLNCAIGVFKLSSACSVELVGNLPSNSFDMIANLLEKKDFGPKLDNDPMLYKPIASTPAKFFPGEKCLRIKSLINPRYITTVTNYYVMGYNTIDEWMCFNVAFAFMKSYVFNYLRSHLQLGYDAFPQEYYIGRSYLVAFSITITSTATEFTACEIDEKIDEFLSQYGNKLNSMDDCIFETYRRLQPEDGRIPSRITKKRVSEWINRKFGPEFKVSGMDGLLENKCLLKGMQKLSFQVIPYSINREDERNKMKLCCCRKCIYIADYVPGKAYKSTLLFARGQGAVRNYFVDSLLNPLG